MADSVEVSLARLPSGRNQAKRLARLYLVLSRTNRAIAQARDEHGLLTAACETIVSVGGFRMSWAGAADRATGEIKPIAYAGHADGYLESVGIRIEGVRSEGPTGQAFREQRTVVCDDVATDPRMAPWRERALERDYRSSVGLPISKSGRPFGILTVYADQPHRFDAGEVDLLEELARDVSFGLSALDAAAERRRAEAALEASEGRFQTSLDTLLDPFVLLRAVRDKSGTIVDFAYEYANDAACEANRVPRERLLGMTLLELLPEHEGAGLLAAYARVIETGEPLVIDDLDYLDTWGGEEMARVFDVRASKVGDSIAYTWRDITDRRQLERRRADELEHRVRERTSELEAARERAIALAGFSTTVLSATTPGQVARRLLDTVRGLAGAVDGIVAIRRDDAPPEILATFGYTQRSVDRMWRQWPRVPTPIGDALGGKTLLVIDGIEAFRSAYPDLTAAIQPQDRARVVVALGIGEGPPIAAASLGFERPHPFDDGERAFFVALANAAAHALERLRLADAEREARGMLDAVVAQMPAGVTIVGRAGQPLYRNAALDRIFRLDPGGPAGELAATHPDGRRYAADEWPAARSVESGEVVVNEEITVLRGDGTQGVVMQTSAPVRDTAGRVVGAVVVTLDVTERKEAEQLREAFLGVLSHELRTPVTTIFGGTKMLAARAERLDPEIRQGLLEDVASEADRLNRLVDDLLVLARAERGVDLTARGAALVQHRIRAVVQSIALERPDRQFTTEIPERVPPVTGDEAYLEQVLRNLIGNAAKYGRSTVEVRVRVLERAVEVSVLDDGPGVDPAEQDSIFELFSRAAATRMLPGAGIGLFVARKLVEAMGGELTVADRPEGGAVFTFWLPQFADTAEG